MEGDSRPELAEGDTIGGYVVVERIGRGGFGEVVHARHVVLGREVAIKVLHRQRGDAVERFVAEARVVSRISHPSIVEIFDFGQLEDGRHYFVMELLRGRTLRELIRGRGPLALQEALPILRGIAAAVDAAHSAGVAHRDLKPENIFLVDETNVKLIDFGLAKLVEETSAHLTETGTTLGTPAYMSPEQCRGKRVGLATDLYSFGVIAYELLAGTPPFSGDPLALALAHLNDKPERLSQRAPAIAPHVDAVVLRLLDKRPDARGATLGEAVDAIESAPGPRSRWRVGAAMGVALALVGVIAFGVLRNGTATGERTYRRSDRLLPPGAFMSWFTLSSDARALLLVDSESRIRFDLSTGAVERIPGADLASPDDQLSYSVELPGGELLVTKCGHDCDVLVEDPRTHVRRVVLSRSNLDGSSAEPSPDGSQFAIVVFGSLEVVSIATGDVRRVADLARHRIAGLRWAPGGHRVVWYTADPAEQFPLHITDIDTGATTAVEARFEHAGAGVTVGDWVDNDHIAYCSVSRSERIAELHVHALLAHTDRVVATLAHSVEDCNLSVKAGRIAVHYRRTAPRIAVLDPATGVLRTLSDLDLTPEDVVSGRVYARRTEAPFTDVLATPPAGSELVEVLPDGTTRPTPSCAGDAGVVKRGDRLVHFDARAEGPDLVLRMRDVACAKLDEWRLPGGGRWGRPRCGATTCAIAGIVDAKLVVFELPVQAPARLRHTGAANANDSPELAVADDGRIVVAASTGMYLLDGNGVTIVPVRQSAGVAWLGDKMVKTTQGVGGASHGVATIAPDGTPTLLWGSRDIGLYHLISDAGLIYGAWADWGHLEVAVFDPAS